MEKQNKNNEKEKTSAAKEFYGWAQSLIWVFLTLILICSFFIRMSGVSGSSMLPTLHNGDCVLVNLQYDTPERGDVIVVLAPRFDDEPLVKRVIGIAGDEIDVDGSGHVTVNGETLKEDYIYEKNFTGGTTAYPYYVGEGEVFVMGDNRNNSADSRMSNIAALQIDDIIGKVFLRLWPIGSFGGI